MFAMAYGSEVDMEDMDNITNLMEQMIECISEVHPEFMQKPKFHVATFEGRHDKLWTTYWFLH